MRMLLRAAIDNRAADQAIKNGTLPKILESIVDQIQPEAAYFTGVDSQRGLILVFDMKESSQLPAFTERLFRDLDAKVTLQPAMNLEDLRTGLAAVMR